MILRGDARALPLADGVVQCVVTSPPYWGLRDYGVGGQIGLEGSIGEYVETMVGVMREVWRVLRGDGTVWMNLGDSYATVPHIDGATFDPKSKGRVRQPGAPNRQANCGVKPKDLCGIPWRVALALQADGWYLRSDIIWAKPNPMPESVTDRPTRSHEYLFLLTKSDRYYYDADAIREPTGTEVTWEKWFNASGRHAPSGNLHQGVNAGFGSKMESFTHPNGRNRRDVWTINSEPFPEAHFATFPKALVQPCVLAGTPERGSCGACGKPCVRVTEDTPEYATFKASKPRGIRSNDPAMLGLTRGTGNPSVTAERQTLGWRAQCGCGAAPRPALVFDPFLGSGTVGEVCAALGRRWVGTDLSMDYLWMAQRRTAQQGLFSGGVMEVSR